MRRVTEIALGLTLGAGVGFGVGAAAGKLFDEINIPPSVDGVQLEIDVYKSELADAEELNADLSRYGTACLNVLKFYEQGGPLADTSEDDMVADVAKYPNQPCGNNEIDVRVVSRAVLPVREQLNQLEQYDINAKYAELDKNQQQIKKDETDDESLRGAITGSVMIGLLGLCTACGFILEKED